LWAARRSTTTAWHTCFTLSCIGSMWQIESHTSFGWRCTSACMARHQIICLSAVYTGRSSCWTTASSFHQLPSTRCSTLSARYVRPSYLRCRWINNMELVPKQFAWAGHANWLFSSYTEDVSFWSVLCTLSALEVFCIDALYKLTFTLHYTHTAHPTAKISSNFYRASAHSLSVCPLLHENGLKYCHSFFTIR